MTAITIAVLFFVITYWIALKRKCQLQATSEVYIRHEKGEDKKIMQIHMTNTSRHQLLLRALVLDNGHREERIFFSSSQHSAYQSRYHGFIALEEGESHDVIVGLHAPCKLLRCADPATRISMFIEDTTGQRFSIKKSKTNIRHLFSPVVF